MVKNTPTNAGDVDSRNSVGTSICLLTSLGIVGVFFVSLSDYQIMSTTKTKESVILPAKWVDLDVAAATAKSLP